MLRIFYLALACIFAILGMVSTVAGFAYTIHQLTTVGLSLDEAMSQGTMLGFAISAVSFTGWIVFSYLFIREDEVLEGNTERRP